MDCGDVSMKDCYVCIFFLVEKLKWILGMYIKTVLSSDCGYADDVGGSTVK